MIDTGAEVIWRKRWLKGDRIQWRIQGVIWSYQSNAFNQERRSINYLVDLSSIFEVGDHVVLVQLKQKTCLTLKDLRTNQMFLRHPIMVINNANSSMKKKQKRAVNY